MEQATFGRRRTGAITGAATRAPLAAAAPRAANTGAAEASDSPSAAPRVASPTGISADAQAVLAGKPPQWATVTLGQLSFGVLAMAGLLSFLLYFYGAGVARDLLYAGSYKPTITAVASNGDCTRYQMIVTLCSATLSDKDTGSRRTTHFMVAFSGMGGEPMRAVRSTSNPTVVALGVSAIDYLWNRTISLGLMVLLLGIGLWVGARKLATGRYKNGAAFHALVAEVEGIAARQQSPKAPA